MADNSSLPVASGNETFANEDIGPGVKYPTPKIVWGANGVVNRTDIAAGKMLPIQLRYSATGAELSDATGLKISTNQLTAVQTTAVPMTTQYTLVGFPTDQVVPNKVQNQSCGMTSSRINSAATANANFLKAAAGNVGNVDLFNIAAYDVFFKFFNKASAPTLGTDTPILTIPLKAGTGFSRTFLYGKWFSTGIAYAITRNQVDTDATAIALGDCTGAIDWI